MILKNSQIIAKGLYFTFFSPAFRGGNPFRTAVYTKNRTLPGVNCFRIMADYFIGADIGTSSSKALAFSPGGKILAQSQVTYPTLRPRAGYAEQDPDVIVEALTRAIHRAVRASGQGSPAFVCLSAAMHSLMAVDGKGKPLSKLMIWSDARSEHEADKLKGTAGGKDIYRHTGTPIHPMSPLCKLLWWKNHQQASFRKAARFISIKDYILFRYFGEYVVDYSLASATGMFDHSALKWYGPALEVTGLKKERLCEPVSPLETLRGMDASFARKTGLGRDTPFVIGASDGCLANLGTGVTAKGELAVTIGTSGAVRLFHDRPINDPHQRLFNYLLLKNEFVTGGAINNGGVLLDWFRDRLMETTQARLSYEDFLEEAFSAECGSRGLLLLPYLQGERSPMWDARARGAFIGIHSGHGRAHFMRAVIEGICYSLYNVVSIMEGPRTPISTVYVSGGFTRSTDWVRMLTDLFNIPSKVSGKGDASSIGAVFMGMRAMKIIDSWHQTSRYLEITATYRPRKKPGTIYRRNYEVFAGMYELLKDAMHTIAGWQAAAPAHKVVRKRK